MRNATKSMMLGLLLVPFALVPEATKVLSEEITEKLPEMPMMLIPTDNGSTNVAVVIDKGIVEDSQFTIDQPQAVTFNIRFLDPTTGEPVEHLNYAFMVADANGNVVHKVHEGHTHNGMNSYSLLFSNKGTFTLTIDIEGTGAMKPYDSTYSGTASSMVSVVPEFPMSVMAIMAAVVGITIASTRFKNPLKL